ncbi:TPA: hypothetical protein ACT9CC_002973 [Legionella pneumophila]
MSKHKQVTEKILIEIQQSGRPFILEQYEGTEEIPKLWLFHDVNTLSYILVMRNYNNDKKGRCFNHIVIDDSFPNSTIAGSFEKAIRKIREGKCFIWQSNGNFAQLDKCNMPHC